MTSLASASPDLARADYLHICCSPEHLWLNVLPELELDLAADESHPAGAAASPSVTAANVASGSSNATPRKRMIYEPLPPSCTPSSLPLLCRILPHIHLFSPNHEEAASLLGLGECAQVEMMAQEFSEMGARRVVIRAGEKGSYVLERERRGAERQVEGNWVAPYHQKPEKVVDTVGAGNSFLVSCLASRDGPLGAG